MSQLGGIAPNGRSRLEARRTSIPASNRSRPNTEGQRRKTPVNGSVREVRTLPTPLVRVTRVVVFVVRLPATPVRRVVLVVVRVTVLVAVGEPRELVLVLLERGAWVWACPVLSCCDCSCD